MVKTDLKFLSKKLEIKAGFLNPRSPFVYLNEDEDGSFWNFEQNFIQVGVKTILEKAPDRIEELSELLLAHEVSHTLHTDAEIKIDFPFPILNILEDERIERLMNRYDFHDLHEFSYEQFYLDKPANELEKMLRNPYNIGVLLRWQRWGVKTSPGKPDALTEEEFEEFLSDWKTALEKSASATFTEEVAKIGKALYEKWRHVFGEKAPEDTVTGIEKSERDFGNGEKKEEGEEKGRDKLGREPDEIRENPHLFKSPMFTWDEEWIRRTLAEIKRHLKLPAYTETEFRMTGRRIDSKRAENLLPPFRRKETISYSLKNHRVLVVIDGSGSMNGVPHYWASHTAKVLSQIFNTDIVIVTTESRNPIRITDTESLRGYNSDGGENYISLKDLPLKYDFTLFLTDAHVSECDWEYAMKLSRLCKVGAGYVYPQRHTGIEDALRKVFGRYFYSKPERVGIEIALFLKRLFVRRG